MFADRGEPAGPEENTTTADHHGASADEPDDEKRVLGSTYLEQVRDAEVEHVLCGRMYHMRGAMVAQAFGMPSTPDLGGRHAGRRS